MHERAQVGAAGLGPLVLLAALAVACGSKDEQPAGPKPPPTGPFALTDYYSPRSLETVADGDTLRITSGSSCIARQANARGVCVRFEEPSESSYGFVFAYPGFDFGKQPGMTLPATISKLHFVAAVTESSLFKIVDLRVGWLSDPGAPYPEDQISQSQVFHLTSAWQAFEIPLLKSGPMLGNALGSNALGPITFYLDDMWFE